MKQVILILSVFALLFVGCGEKQEENPVVDIAIGLVQQSDSLIDVIHGLERENWQLECDKRKLYCKLQRMNVSCPPCPDTVYKYASPSVLVRMPPGTWVDADEFYTFYLNQFTDSQRFKNQIFPWPDSMFFLSK